MLYTKYDKYRFNSNTTFQISDLENPEAIDEYLAGYTELYNMCDRLNCHTIPKPDEMKANIMQHLNSGTEPAIFINLDLRDFPGFSKKFTQDCFRNVIFQLKVVNEEHVRYSSGVIPQSVITQVQNVAQGLGIPAGSILNHPVMVFGLNGSWNDYQALPKPRLVLQCELPIIDRSNLANSMAGIVSTANVRLPLGAVWGEQVNEFNGVFNLDIFKEKLDEYEKELLRELDMDKDLKIAVDDTKKNGKVYKDRMKEIKELLATETDKAKIKALKLESKNCRAGYEGLLSKHLDVIQRKYDLKKDFE